MGLADQICRISTVDATLPWRANPDPETCQTVLSSLQSNPDAIFVLQNIATSADQPRWQDDPLVLLRCDLQTPGSGHKHAFTTSDEVSLQKTSGVAQRACRVHIVSMTHDSKIFVGLRSTRKRSPAASEPKGPKCQWDGCEKIGTHRAPLAQVLKVSTCSSALSMWLPTIRDTVSPRHHRVPTSPAIKRKRRWVRGRLWESA